MKKTFVLLMMALATCNISAKSNFVQVKDGHFVRDGKPYYYVGTNFWYGAILGSEGQGGNRERLCKELDKMKEMGIDRTPPNRAQSVCFDVLDRCAPFRP